MHRCLSTFCLSSAITLASIGCTSDHEGTPSTRVYGSGTIRAVTGDEFQWINSIWGSSPHDLYLASNYSPLIHLTDVNDAGWTELSIPGNPRLVGVWGSSANDVYAVGDGIWHSTDGVAWTQLYSAPGHYFTAAWGTSSSDVYFVGYEFAAPPLRGLVVHTTDGGRTLSTTFVPATAKLSDVWGSSAQDLYAVGIASGEGLHGAIVHSTDAGTSWQLSYKSDDPDLRKIVGTRADNVYAAGDRGIVRSTDGGVTWTLANATPHLDALWATGDNDIYAGGFLQSAVRTSDGVNWSSFLPPDYSVYALWATSATDIFAGGRIGATNPDDDHPMPGDSYGSIMHLQNL